MDCLEFRRILAADPHRSDRAFLAHRDACPSGCADRWWRAQRAERRLLGVLQSVEVPPDLQGRILLAQATASRGEVRARRRWRIGLAVAASLLLAAVALGCAWKLGGAGDALPNMAIADILGDEVYSLTLTVPLDDHALHAAFAGRGVAMRGIPRHAVYASDCMVGPYRAVHLVLREHGKPVTAMYLVGHRVARARDFQKSHWRGRELPMGDGTLVLLGFGTRGFAEAERAMAEVVLGPAPRGVG